MDTNKVKTILKMPEPHTEKQVQGFLGRLNYIARFISQLTATWRVGDVGSSGRGIIKKGGLN